MTTDALAAVKAEIKAWERQFRAEHGRNPSKDDMKAAPGMPERYRRYKELGTAHADPPSHARNPFSPQKAKGPPDATAVTSRAYLLLDDDRVVPNPFSTPPRSRGRKKPAAKRVRERSNSPDLDAAFPAIGTARPIDTPTTRARKRLRGEHVPPSPDKPARTRSFARVHSESLVAPKSAFSQQQPALADEDDAIDESPAKSTAQNFRPIFDETPPDAPAPAVQRASLTRSRTLPIFGRTSSKLAQRLSEGEASDDDDDDDGFALGPIPAPIFMTNGKGKAPSMPSPPSSIPEPTKKSLPFRRTNSTASQAQDSHAPQRNGRKRALPDVEEESEMPHDEDEVGEQERMQGAASSSAKQQQQQQYPAPVFSGLALLPPSPPPVKASWEPKGRGKPKPGTTAGPSKRKKPRLEEEDEDDREEVDVGEVREVRWRSHGKLPLEPDERADEDDALAEWEREMRFMRQRLPLPEPAREEDEEREHVDVNVPSDMLSVLALDDSPDRHHQHNRRAERAILRDLLVPVGDGASSRVLGRAEDVWAPGEAEDEDGPDEDEDDDWADEGMRWDEAEL